jgi:hypothetical protein
LMDNLAINRPTTLATVRFHIIKTQSWPEQVLEYREIAEAERRTPMPEGRE